VFSPNPLLPSSGRVILLNGFPGVGKFSIGRKLFDMFDHKHARFIDNHLLIDSVQAIIPGRGADHKALRHEIRRIAFDALSAIEDESTTLILTSCLSSTDEDRQVFEEHLTIAFCRQVPFYLFNISCDKKEHHNRLVTHERSAGSKSKLVIPEVLDDMLVKHKLVEIGHEQTHLSQTSVEYMFEVDTTLDSIDESASKIYAMVTGCMTPESSDKDEPV
jgi:chloramphenicol 3-O-phosphotransferase